MRTHVTVLGWLFIALHVGYLLLGAVAFLFFGGMGGVAVASGGHQALPALPILGAIGSFLMMVGLILGLPGVIVGWGLLQYANWARIIAIIMSILSLFTPPLGTALGIYGLVVLFNPETTALFERR